MCTRACPGLGQAPIVRGVGPILNVFNLQQLIFGVAVGAVYSLIALGFNMTFRSAGFLNLAHQEFMMVGALIGFSAVTLVSANLLLALLLSGVATALVALAVNAIGLAPVYRRKGGQLNTTIATIGWGMILSNTAMLLSGTYAKPYPDVASLPSIRAGSLFLDGKVLFALLAAVGSMLVLHLFLSSTRVGQAMRATAEDPEVAELMGIRPSTVRALALGISGFLGGIAGVLVGTLYYANFDIGILGLKSLSAAVLGGFGSIPGAIAGGLVLGVAENFVGLVADSKYRDFLTYGLIVVTLLIRPAGLMGTRRG